MISVYFLLDFSDPVFSFRSVARCCSGLWRAAVPPYAASSSSVCIGRRPRLCRVCRSRLVPCRCSALCRVVILGLHRSPSPFVPCRRSDLRRIVIRCLRRVAVPVCGWPPPENSADGLAGNLCGLRGSCGLSLRCGDSGRSPARFFVALNFQISFYFRYLARL